MSGSRSKIFSLKQGAGRTGKGGSVGRGGSGDDRAAGLLARLQERCKPLLQNAVQTLFDHTDDALFELADKAGSNGEQNMYFESMREVRIRRRGIELALGRHLHEGFRLLGEGVALAPGREATDSASAGLALVDHDELEEMVAVDTMTAKAEKEFAGALLRLTACLQSVVSKAELTVRNHPLTPACLSHSFLQATADMGLDIKARLVLFKLFDRHVLGALGDLYAIAERWLAGEGIEPAPGGHRTRQSEAAGAAPPHPAGAAEPEALFTDLQTLLEQARDGRQAHGSGRRGLVAPGLAPALPRQALMQLLADIQQQQLAALADHHEAQLRGIPPRHFDILRALDGALTQRLPDQAVSIGQVDDDAINLVSMLFQFVLDDRNLAAPIKGLIARLQIPILKVSMLDKSFFGKGGHPARKLLNEMANASLGWTPAGDLERDALYVRIRRTVAFVVDEFDGDVAIFHQALADFSAFMEMEQRRAALVEQRTIDAEDGRARSEVARRTVDQLLDTRLGEAVPSVVVRLLREGWSNVLFLVCLKEGQESEEWRQALATADELIASVAPVATLADRARLLRTLPGLLKGLRAGLAKVGVSPFELNEMFAELEQLHLQRLKKEEVAELVAAPRAEQVPDAPELQPTPCTVEAPVAPAEPPVLAEAPTVDELLAAKRRAPQSLSDLDRELAACLDEPGETGPFAVEPAPAVFLSDAEVPTATVASVAAPALPAPPESESPDATDVARLAPVPARDSGTLARIDRLQVGGWVELRQTGGAMLRCRLAAVIRATGKFIFVNRAGIKVAENNREGLADLLAGGALEILDEGRLFDRALESVIGNLREMRERN